MLDRVVEAVVQAGGRETAYVRAGAGRPVVLLLRARRAADAGSPADAGGAAGGATDPLFAALAREFRVVAPTLPDGPLLLERVRDVIDGLGLVRPALLVDAALAGSLAGVAFSGDDRCGCFVVLHPAPSVDGQSVPVAYRSHLGCARLLELPVDDDGVGLSATSLAALIGFLRTDCCASGD